MVKTTVPPEITTVQQPATTVQVKTTEKPTVFGEYSWVEYRNNITVTMPPNPRYQWEMDEKVEHSSVIYKGIPAIHYTLTETSDYPEWVGNTLIHTANGRITVTDRYFDVSTNAFLGGTTSETLKGTAKPLTDLPVDTQFSREDRPSYEMGIMPFGEMNITLTYGGTESVTVPVGTYLSARRYTGAFRDGTPVSFWVVPDIPVPVRYQFPNKYLDGEDPFQSYELKGWG